MNKDEMRIRNYFILFTKTNNALQKKKKKNIRTYIYRHKHTHHHNNQKGKPIKHQQRIKSNKNLGKKEKN